MNWLRKLSALVLGFAGLIAVFLFLIVVAGGLNYLFDNETISMLGLMAAIYLIYPLLSRSRR